uniref:Putative single-stranded DNA binding protein n=1 Tax=Porolithon onkodes TaxID=231751 RepID=A0A2Z2KXT1_9FLOR|nr:putative single-stranded DNA binding protein [Porolithon onkodes]ASB29772.1 putative single-stranded DNA binding protein [Porolithon onkodes]
MDPKNFKKHMTGHWIAQSTHYSLTNIKASSCNFVNRIKWLNIKKPAQYLDSLSKENQIDLLLKDIYLYHIQLNNSIYKYGDYYIVLMINQFNQAYLLKFDISFKLINKFFIKEITEDYLCVLTSVNKYQVLQKIYFLNRHLKLIKVTIKDQQNYIGTSFTSEIRIS